MKTILKEHHLRALKTYMQNLDLLLVIPVYDSYTEMIRNEDLEILMQPGMVYTHSIELISELLKNESWVDECGIEDKIKFMERADNHVKGIILENSIIANTYLNYSCKDIYVSKLHIKLNNGDEHEADMIVFDKRNNLSYLFEVKYNKEQHEDSIKHLDNIQFIEYVNDNFGTVAGRYVIYNGPNSSINGINYINSSDYFKAIYQNKDNWIDAIKVINELPCRRSKNITNELSGTLSYDKTDLATRVRKFKRISKHSINNIKNDKQKSGKHNKGR